MVKHTFRKTQMDVDKQFCWGKKQSRVMKTVERKGKKKEEAMKRRTGDLIGHYSSDTMGTR